MSLTGGIGNLITRVGTEFKALRTLIGDLTSLTTTQKTNLVVAINEIQSAVASATGIDDGSTGTGTTWSSDKIAGEIVVTINNVLGSASAAYDTLGEIQALMEADDTQTSSILTALGNRVSTEAGQGLTSTQKANARNNIDVYSKAEIGDPTTDFVAAFEIALT